MNKRIIAVLLTICTLISVLHIPGVVSANAESSYDIAITVNGEKADKITVPQNEKKEIAAVCSPANENAKYSWQICADLQNDLWVDIYGANEKTLNLSYALMSSLLDGSGSAYIRAELTVNSKSYYSEPICATVAFNAKFETEVENQDTVLTKSAARKMRAMAVAESDLVTITINYLDYESKKEIYSPYTATLEKGKEFKQSVISPTFLGYAPYVVTNENGTDTFTSASTYDLNYAAEELTEDVIINIYYKAIEVQYAVSYFFQNINNDLYTERTDLYFTGKAETGTIITDEILTSHAGNTEGFSKLYHYPETVAADGSTVFQCYYDRNYYLLKFDMAGGYGVDPIYARYETPYIITDPIRHGYVFAGWDLLTEDTNNNGEPDKGDGVADPLPATIGIGNKNYRALWTNAETTYTVVYWLENAQDENGDAEGNGYSYLASKKDVAAISNDKVSGANHKITNESAATALGINAITWKYSEYSHADSDVVVKGDGSTVVNVYYSRKEYTLKFYYAMSRTRYNNTTYYVVGGSTYAFGASAKNVDEDDEIALLDQYITANGYAADTGNVGQITALPTLNENGESKNYTLGTDDSDKSEYVKYHYISFTAKYGANIENIWPADVFNSATRTDDNTKKDWDSKIAFVSAWNGEHNVYYSQNNTNQTIKGKYERLNYEILWADEFGSPTDNTVSYLCFWENGANNDWNFPELYRYHIYVPLFENQSTDGLTVRTYNGVKYYEIDVYNTYDDSDANGQTAPGITGLTYLAREGVKITGYDTSLYHDAYDVYFYYSRNEYDLSFINYGQKLEIPGTPDGDYGVLYGKSLYAESVVPPYPDTLEPNAYYFDGWYESPTHSEESKVVFNENTTMPAHNWQLYAKYTPTQHTVRFFDTRADMLEYQKTKNEDLVSEAVTVDHGSPVGAVTTPTDPTGLGYSFGGWFYYADDATMQSFAAFSMPVTDDMLVFAEWGSKKAQPYLIHYALEAVEVNQEWLALLYSASDNNPKENRSYSVTNGEETRNYVYVNDGYHLQIADDTNGYAYEGSTRTFKAKAGDPYNQLYDAYNTSYFPTLASHSITIASEQEGIDQPENNVFTFFYVYPELPIEYTVRYLDKQTKLPVAKERILTTTSAVVTERFTPVTDYVPDAFYKRLIISVEYDEEKNEWVGSAEDNIITFYYTKNETAAYYAVHYMLQKPGTDGTNYNTTGVGDYEADDSIIEGIGDINKTVNIAPLTFDGFKVQKGGKIIADGETDNISANSNGEFVITVTENGTELYIYYTRLKYDVKVRYLKYNTGEPVDENNDPVETMKDKDFGTVVSHTAPKIVDGYALVDTENMTKSTVVRSNEAQNVITFYYTELQYTAEYKIIGNVGGTLSSTIEVINSSDAFVGSTATAKPGYKFIGWYLDEDGTVSADTKATVTNTTLVPNVAELEPMPTTNIFYAKFELQTADLTITRKNAVDESNGSQVFVYRITDNTDNSKVYYATITGNDSAVIKDLPCVNYTVEQVNSWSWRYEDGTQTVELTENKTVTFQKTAAEDKWLNGNSEIITNKRR